MAEKKRILVVEDNRDNMTLILDLLQSLDYETITAGDGAEAVKAVEEQKPALILLDLSLPRVDGWSAARTLKGNPDLASIPIIALTAHALLGDRERALEAGCDDYVSKPINLRELTGKLAQYLGG